jgi:hypothetical protein
MQHETLVEIREHLRAALASLADSGTGIETGYLFGFVTGGPVEFSELFITIDGSEYSVRISEVK